MKENPLGMLCPNCQRENNAGVSFCAFCGQYLAAGQTPQPTGPAVPPLPNFSVPPPPAMPPPIPPPMCLVCGQIFAPQIRTCPRCKTPRGMIVNPEDTTGSTYLPYGIPNAVPWPYAPPQQGTQRSVAAVVIIGVVAVIGLTILSIAIAVSVGSGQ